MTDDKLYTSLSANTIMAKLTNHVQRTRLKTSSTDKHYSLVPEDDFLSGCRNLSHQQQFFSELHSPGDHTIRIELIMKLFWSIRRTGENWLKKEYTWKLSKVIDYFWFSACFVLVHHPHYVVITGMHQERGHVTAIWSLDRHLKLNVSAQKIYIY